MQLILSQEHPEDFVIGTGQTHTVREFLKIAFDVIGLNYQDYLVIDPLFFRSAEVEELMADSSHAKKQLNWASEVEFEDLVSMMVEADYNYFKRQ